MKKNYLFGMLALAAMTMVGCSNDEVVNDYSQDNAIQFGTYVGRDAQGRGAVEDIASVATTGFGVFAFYTDEGEYGDQKYTSFEANFMDNQHVKGTAGEGENPTYTWSYDPVKYWPNEDTDYVSFLAYAPYDEDYELDTDNPSSINFTVNPTVAEQVDLLYNSTKHYNVSKQTINENIKFLFKHALTRVGFKAKLMVDNVNPDDDGTLDDTDDDGSTALGDETTVAISKVELIAPFYTGGTLNLDNGAWSDYVGGTEDVIYTLEGDALQNNTDIRSLKTPDDRINTDNNFMMLIPTDKPIKVKVTYTVTTTDGELDNGSIAVTNVIESTPFTISQAVDNENKRGLLQGKAYNLVLHIGLTSVKFDVEFVDWVVDDEYEVNVPNNKE